MNIFFKQESKTGSVELEMNVETKSIIQHWKGFTDSKLFRAGIDETFKKMKETGYVTLISNTLEHKPVLDGDKRYAIEQWVKYCQENKVQVGMIFIDPEALIARYSTGHFTTWAVKDGMKEPVTMKSLEDAKKFASAQ